MFGLRGTELLLILVVLLLLFGATRLPQLGSSLGSAIRNFKKGFNTDESAEDEASKPNQMQSTTTVDASKDAKDSARVS